MAANYPHLKSLDSTHLLKRNERSKAKTCNNFAGGCLDAATLCANGSFQHSGHPLITRLQPLPPHTANTRGSSPTSTGSGAGMQIGTNCCVILKSMLSISQVRHTCMRYRPLPRQNVGSTFSVKNLWL